MLRWFENFRLDRLVFCSYVFFLCGQVEAETGILVASLEGNAVLSSGVDVRQLPAFGLVEAGGHIEINKARLALLYFPSGRLETYQGTGRIELQESEGGFSGSLVQGIKFLPSHVAKQISRLPTQLERGYEGLPRTRSIPTPDAISRVNKAYQRLRLESAANDLSPEMFRLSALFELRAVDAVESAILDLQAARPDQSEAKLLASLYRKALRNMNNKK